MLKKSIVVLCSLMTVTVFGMKSDDVRENTKKIDIIIAGIAAGLTPAETEEKIVIDVSEISQVTRRVDDKGESYTARLPYGDILKTNLLKSGKYACFRLIKSDDSPSRMPELMVDDYYFHVLKQKYEESQTRPS